MLRHHSDFDRAFENNDLKTKIRRHKNQLMTSTVNYKATIVFELEVVFQIQIIVAIGDLFAQQIPTFFYAGQSVTE